MKDLSLSTKDLRSRLSSGANAQELLGGLMESISKGFNLTYIDSSRVSDCIVLLAEHGARVATDEPGCALETLIRQKRNGQFLDLLACRLASQPDELPFHVMARESRLQIMSVSLDSQAIQASLHARDRTGRTVSHYLWDPECERVQRYKAISAMNDDSLSENEHRAAWVLSNSLAWHSQVQLNAWGMGMSIPDHQGITALDLCVDRLDAGEIYLCDEFEICQQVSAHKVHRQMSSCTDVPAVHRAGPRL